MGTAYFVVTDKAIDGYDVEAMEGKMLAKADQKLEKTGFYAERGLQPLHTFCGDDLEEFLEEFDFESAGPDDGGEKWFEPAAGLVVVRALTEHLRANPGLVKLQDVVLDDLVIVENALRACEESGSRWYLSIDI